VSTLGTRLPEWFCNGDFFLLPISAILRLASGFLPPACQAALASATEIRTTGEVLHAATDH
jgi:hypothetical protein